MDRPAETARLTELLVERHQRGRLGTHGQALDPFRPMRDFRERLADRFAGGLPPVFGVLLHPSGSKVMQRVFGLPSRTEVTAKIQQDGFHGTGSDVDAEE
jgi:hypothetical protein